MAEDRNQNEGGDRPPEETEREPGEGPRDRIRAFFEERFTTAGPKDQIGEQSEDEQEPLESPYDPEYRQELTDEYRKRQREELAELREQHDDWYREREAQPEGEAPEAVQTPPAENWVPIGPSANRRGQAPDNPPMGGRVARLSITPSGSRVYAATANGGVWRSDDDGETWEPTMRSWDQNPTEHTSDSLACGAIATDQSNPDRVYVGTGEGDTVLPSGTQTAYFGVGPVRTDTGGLGSTPWNSEATSGPSPTLAGASFYEMVVDPGNGDRVVAATTTGIYRREPDGSGGFEWDQKQTGRFSSVVVARTGGTTTFYAAQWGGNVFESTDGDTWNTLGSGFPTSSVGRIGLAVQPSNPDTVYALITDPWSTRGVWRYDASDDTWRQVSENFGTRGGPGLFNGQGFYDLAIDVDPTNEDRIYIGGATAPAPGVGRSDPDRWSSALYRCSVSQSGTGSSRTYSLSATRIGEDDIHADIHDIVVDPNNNDEVWVASDGGVFYTDDATGTATFEHRNTALGNQTLNHLGQHPDEDAVLFAGSQDQGTLRYTGEEDWLHANFGDGGFAVVNWDDPYKVLVTYPRRRVLRSTDGGSRYSFTELIPRSSPIRSDRALFYAPLVGTPPNPGSPGEADRVAFGTTRPWVSDDFGGSWGSIPNGSTSDRLGSGGGFRIKSMVFESYDRLYVGTMNGRIYRYDDSGSMGSPNWSRTRIDNKGGTNSLPSGFSIPVTDIAVDPADSSGDSIYVTFGGDANDYRRVWHFDGSQWAQRSGPSGMPSDQLLDVQHNAIAINPDDATNLFVGADIGVWESTDAGSTWSAYAAGLPDAAVLDLRFQTDSRHAPLLRASTHGRGAFERLVGAGPQDGVELYVRDTQLDQGRYPTDNFLDDPTQKGRRVRHYRGPDIKVDAPTMSGDYQLPAGDIDFHQFVDELTDESRQVPVKASATLTSRVYVQVHNRGLKTADNVRVMLLLTNASAGLPALPSGYETKVQNGTRISTADWETVGIKTLDGVEPRVPQVAQFDLPSSKLPPPSRLSGNQHHCVLALVHHADDQYTSMETNTDRNSIRIRKAAHKNLKVIQFDSGPSASAALPVRFNNPSNQEAHLGDFEFVLEDYPGRVLAFLPDLEIEGNIQEAARGLERTDEFEAFEEWAHDHVEWVEENQASDHAYNERWAKERIRNVERVLEAELAFAIEDEERAALRSVVFEPGESKTVFLLFDRPQGRVGDAYPVDVRQRDSRDEEVIGGLMTRVELAPEPKQHELEVWSHDWPFDFTVVRARLRDPDRNLLTPEDDAEVELTLGPEGREKRVRMRWHEGWESFYHFERLEDPAASSATARGVVVREESEVARSRLDGLE